MSERYFDFWKKNTFVILNEESTETNPDDTTSPLPEVFVYGRILDMMGNIYTHYPNALKESTTFKPISVEIETMTAKILGSRKPRNSATFSFMCNEEFWFIDLALKKRKIGYVIDTVQKKISGSVYVLNRDGWVKQEDVESPYILSVPILMDLEKAILQND